MAQRKKSTMLNPFPSHSPDTPVPEKRHRNIADNIDANTPLDDEDQPSLLEEDETTGSDSEQQPAEQLNATEPEENEVDTTGLPRRTSR